MCAGRSCCLNCYVVVLVGKRPDLKKKFGFFKWISQQFLTVISRFFSSFRAKKEENPKWLKLAIQNKIQLCVFPKFAENRHFRSGVVFTPKVRMKHVDRHWKSYLAGNKEESPEFECGEANY